MKNKEDKKKIAGAEDAKTVEMFCANEQMDTEHNLDIDGNGEIVLTCESCERFVKFPADTDAGTLKQYMEEHKAQNEGQITQESLDKKKAELLEGLGIK